MNEWTTFWIVVTLLVFAFWGEPDIHDKVMAWIDRQDAAPQTEYNPQYNEIKPLPTE